MDRYIIQSPDPRLSEVAQPVTDLVMAQDIVRRMAEIAFRIRTEIYSYPRGFEMAAPQIGEPYRIIMLQGDYKPDPTAIETQVLVGPEILEETEPFFNWEDCLSVKDMRGYVRRFGRTKVRYRDLRGNLREELFVGNPAADIQHGIDHLNGLLFFDRDMKYFIPLSVYRSKKVDGVEVLNAHVFSHYREFDRNQNCTPAEVAKYRLVHPRQSLPIE